MANEVKKQQLLLKRSVYKREGKEYHQYFVTGVINKKEKEIRLTGVDIGMYDVLDTIFDIDKSPILLVTPFSMKDDKGEIMEGNIYEAFTEKDGVSYKAKVKPQRPSDKALLEIVLQLLNKKDDKTTL